MTSIEVKNFTKQADEVANPSERAKVESVNVGESENYEAYFAAWLEMVC